MACMNSRQHSRLVVDIDGFAVLPDSATAVQCRVRDISLGGAYLVMDRSDASSDLRIGQPLGLHFWGVGRLAAQVVYKGRDGIGVRFRNDQRSQRQLADRLGDFMRRQLRAWAAGEVGAAWPDAAPLAPVQDEGNHPKQHQPAATHPSTADGDRRASQRWRLIRWGRAIFRDGSCIVSCVILDLSEGGARIRPLDTVDLPEEFVLELRDGEARRCEFVWREGEVIGVRFVAPINSSLHQREPALAHGG